MDRLPDALRYVNGPYALAGLALLVVAGFTPSLMQNVLDKKARRILSFSLLALGGITILGSLLLANQSRTTTDVDAASRDSHAVEVHGQGNIVGNGNVVGDGNTTRQADR